MTEKTQKAFDNILDTMSGADGGIKFVMLKSMVKDIDKQAEEGNEASKQLLFIITRFSRLIDLAEKAMKTHDTKTN